MASGLAMAAIAAAPINASLRTSRASSAERSRPTRPGARQRRRDLEGGRVRIHPDGRTPCLFQTRKRAGRRVRRPGRRDSCGVRRGTWRERPAGQHCSGVGQTPLRRALNATSDGQSGNGSCAGRPRGAPGDAGEEHRFRTHLRGDRQPAGIQCETRSASGRTAPRRAQSKR
jgi:hypothetical protein